MNSNEAFQYSLRHLAYRAGRVYCSGVRVDGAILRDVMILTGAILLWN